MALRVLLADESSSIKKVMQLALQDFGVEVKSVPIGLDVIPVAKNFRPDIIFADVLLAKRSGYDVCLDIKNDPQIGSVPVVLMWSGFMDVDTKKVNQCSPNGRLEKPFDADTLRNLIRQLVPSVNDNVISNYLSFPNLPPITEEPKAREKQPPQQAPTQSFSQRMPPPPAPRPTAPPKQVVQDQDSFEIADSPDDFVLLNEKTPTEQFVPVKPTRKPFPPMGAAAEPTNLGGQKYSVFDEVEEPEEFQVAPLPKQKMALPENNEPDQWSTANLDRFKINLPDENAPSTDHESEYIRSNDGSIEVFGEGEFELMDLDKKSPPKKSPQSHSQPPAPKKSNVPPSTVQQSTLQMDASIIDPAMVEQVLREQVREVLLDIAWKVMPDLAERIVREEIQKLMREAEKLS